MDLLEITVRDDEMTCNNAFKFVSISLTCSNFKQLLRKH